MIDYDALREALRDECYAACFGRGIGPAIMDALSVEDMSPEHGMQSCARSWDWQTEVEGMPSKKNVAPDKS